MIFLMGLSASVILAPILSKVLKLSETKTPIMYLPLFEFGCLMYVISLIVLLLMDENEFNYNENKHEQIV